MLRMIIGDYIVNFKAAYKRMWKRQNHNWFTAVYPFLYMFWFCFLNLDESKNIVIAPMNIIQIIFIIFGTVILFIIQNRKQISNEAILLLLVFLGGFFFHILWEGKSRYIIPYLIILIPLASIRIKEIKIKKILVK